MQLWENGPKFAEFNVGATITDYASATDYTTANVGGLYSWGGTNERREGTTANDQGTAGDNTVTQLWGSSWRMPTKVELDGLVNSSNTEWTWCDGSNTQYVDSCTLAGYKVSGKTGTAYAYNSIFLPAAGHRQTNGTLAQVGTRGLYWTSTDWNTARDYLLTFYSDTKSVGYDTRAYGFSVRPVLNEN